MVAGDRVVVGSDDGRVYVLGLADGKEIWNYDIGQAIQGSPAVVEDHILIGAAAFTRASMAAAVTRTRSFSTGVSMI